MYCGPNKNKVHSWLLRKKSHYRYMGTFLMLVALCTVWAVFVYQPLNCIIELEKQQTSALQEQCINGAEAQKVCEQLEKLLEESRQMLAHTSETEEDSVHYYFTFLLEQIQKAGLSFYSCSRSYENEQDGLAKYLINVKMQGSLKQLLQFFNYFVQSDSYVGCNNLSLSCANDKKLDISCDFTYFVQS